MHLLIVDTHNLWESSGMRKVDYEALINRVKPDTAMALVLSLPDTNITNFTYMLNSCGYIIEKCIPMSKNFQQEVELRLYQKCLNLVNSFNEITICSNSLNTITLVETLQGLGKIVHVSGIGISTQLRTQAHTWYEIREFCK